jgi:hypothetical protein
LAAAILATYLTGSSIRADVLLDDTWEDGERLNSSLPGEAAVYATPIYDVAVAPGALTITMGESSQRLWTYFTESDPVTLDVGQKLVASVKFVPTFADPPPENVSRGFRFGVFHDPSDPHKESDGGSDSGGSGDPWDDSVGYAVFLPLCGAASSTTNLFQIGKRIPGNHTSLLGATAAYVLESSGGDPTVEKSGTEYTVVLTIDKIAADEAIVTASMHQGDTLLATHSVTDKGGSVFGTHPNTNPINDKFDQLFLRLSSADSTAATVKLTNFRVEITGSQSSASTPEP